MNTVTPTHLGGRNGNGVTWKIVIQEEYTFLLRYHSPLFIFSLYLQQRKKQQQLISSLPTLFQNKTEHHSKTQSGASGAGRSAYLPCCVQSKKTERIFVSFPWRQMVTLSPLRPKRLQVFRAAGVSAPNIDRMIYRIYQRSKSIGV